MNGGLVRDDGYEFNFESGAGGDEAGENASAGHGRSEVRLHDLVDGVEVVDVGQIDVALEYVVERRPGLFKDGLEILHDLGGLLLDSAHFRGGVGVAADVRRVGDLAGDEQKASGLGGVTGGAGKGLADLG